MNPLDETALILKTTLIFLVEAFRLVAVGTRSDAIAGLTKVSFCDTMRISDRSVIAPIRRFE